MKREFAKEGLVLNFISGSWYLGSYLGLQKDLEAWVKPQVEAWAYGVRVFGKISQRHPQLSYAGLGMSLQLQWQYLQRTVPGVAMTFPSRHKTTGGAVGIFYGRI